MLLTGGSEGKASVYSVGDPVRALGWEDPLEKEMAIHSRTIAWKIPWTEEPDRLQSMGSQRFRHEWVTSLHFTSHADNSFPGTDPLTTFFSGAVVKNLPGNAIPGSWRSPGVGNDNPPQYSCLENSMDRATWWATVHGVVQSWMQLGTHACYILIDS